MNPFDLWRGLGMAGKAVALAVAAIVVGMALWWAYNVVTAPQRAREAELQSRTDRAHTDAARDAVNTVTERGRVDAQTQDKINEAIKEIRAIPPAERDDATIRALCVLESTRSDPRCARLDTK